MKEKRHIFIGGLHRSGTSLLHNILKEHHAISGFSNTGVPEDEGQHLQSLFPPAKAFGGPGRFGFNPASYMSEMHPLATPENATRLFDEWRQYWDLSKDYLLEKSPPNIVRTRFLQHLFPQSLFIAILRNPIAVAYATQKWCKSSIPQLMDHTLVCYERFFEDKPFLNRANVLQYERLVLDPKEQIENLFSWIGLEMHESGIAVTNDNEKYFTKWREERNSIASSVGMAKMAQFETRMNSYGYSLDEPFSTTELVPACSAHTQSLRVPRP